LDTDHRFASLLHNGVGQQLHILLHGRILEASTHEPFHVKNGPGLGFVVFLASETLYLEF